MKKQEFTETIILKTDKTSSEHIAALYPLFLGLASEKQAKAVSEIIAEKFLYKGDW